LPPRASEEGNQSKRDRCCRLWQDLTEQCSKSRGRSHENRHYWCWPDWRNARPIAHRARSCDCRFAGPEILAALAAETGATAVSVEEAARGWGVVVVSIPIKEIPHLPQGLFKAAPDGLVFIDTSNYCTKQRDGRIEPIERGTTESRWVEQQLGPCTGQERARARVARKPSRFAKPA
jgi:hypothetical protein